MILPFRYLGKTSSQNNQFFTLYCAVIWRKYTFYSIVFFYKLQRIIFFIINDKITRQSLVRWIWINIPGQTLPASLFHREHPVSVPPREPRSQIIRLLHCAITRELWYLSPLLLDHNFCWLKYIYFLSHMLPYSAKDQAFNAFVFASIWYES